MCVNFLSTKLVAMMVEDFLHRRSNTFLTLLLAMDGGGASKLSTICQRSLVANTISNVDLQRLRFLPLTLSIVIKKNSLKAI